MFWRWRNKLKWGPFEFLAPSPLLRARSWLHPFTGHCEQKAMRDEGVIYVTGHPLLNRRCTRLPGCFPKRNFEMHDIASFIMLKVPLNSKQSINQPSAEHQCCFCSRKSCFGLHEIDILIIRLHKSTTSCVAYNCTIKARTIPTLPYQFIVGSKSLWTTRYYTGWPKK